MGFSSSAKSLIFKEDKLLKTEGVEAKPLNKNK